MFHGYLTWFSDGIVDKVIKTGVTKETRREGKGREGKGRKDSLLLFN